MTDAKVAEEKPKLFVKFRKSQKSPTLEINNGDYARAFKADEQPFEVADEEEHQLLKNSGFFIDAKEEDVDEAAADPDAQQAGETPALPAGDSLAAAEEATKDKAQRKTKV